MWKNLFRAVGPILLAPALASAQQIGPNSGALVIVGGAMKDTAIMQRFLELAGGPDAPIVVIPTAGAGEHYDDYYPGLRRWREVGARNLTVVHTRDRKVADTDAFVEPIRKARGVWFPGGRQWRLADAYLDTKTESELHALLSRILEKRGHRVTVSVGWSLLPDDADSAESLLESADRALYAAKETGRDKVVDYHSLQSVETS